MSDTDLLNHKCAYSTEICILKMLGSVDGSLHLPLPSMHRLNQTKPTTSCNSVLLGFLWEFYVIYKVYNWHIFRTNIDEDNKKCKQQ